jgi:hypothetical protein
MKREVITIDVSHYTSKQIVEVVNKWKNKMYNIAPPKTRWQRFKSWLYKVCDTIGISLGFGGI